MKKVLLSALTAFVCLLGAGAALAGGVIGQVPDRILITVKPGFTLSPDKAGAPGEVGIEALDRLAKRFDVSKVDRMYSGLTNNLKSAETRDYWDRVWAVDFPAPVDLQLVKAAYESLPEVEAVQLVDIYRQEAFLPNDPFLTSSQYYLRNMNLGGGDIRAVGGWNQTLGDSNIIIAIVDSGMDWHHPDLGGTHPDKVNGAIWTNWAEYYGTPNVDDDGNGFKDDIRGWDFVNLSASSGWPDEDVTTEDNDPMDYGSHGTNCGGCCAAITNNGVGIAGAAAGCKLMPVRAGYTPNGEDSGVLRSDFISAAILYAANNGAKIINCSWTSTSYLSMAVLTAQQAGCLLVTAAGNENTDDPSSHYLGTYPGVLAVAATDQNDAKADFSNYGDWVELAAPGVAIYTTHYDHYTQTSTYISTQGTSFSSPIAAGAAALLWSAHPTYNYSQIANLLMNSADNIDAVNPAYVGLLGHGRVNVLKALGDNIHRFPAEFPTLFDAMNESSLGDTVGVAAGTVISGPLTVPARGIKLFGGYSADYTTRDPLGAPVQITGNLGGTVLKFFGAVGPETEVDGFRLSGGGGVTYSGIPYFARYGGGATLNNVSPTLRNLEITGNQVGDAGTLGCGGGIMLNNSAAVLENVSIHGNSAVYGGGLFAFNSSPTLINCTIQDNTAVTANLTYAPVGGGLHVLDSDLTMIDCTVSGHTGLENGGGIYAAGFGDVSHLDLSGGTISGNGAKTNGGGLYHSGGSLTMRRVAVTDNAKLATSTFMNGGGLFVSGAVAVLDSLEVTGNEANAGGGVVLSGCASADLSHSVLAGNTALYYGGGLILAGNTAAAVTNCTITGNDGTFSGAGGVYLNAGAGDFTASILAFNTGATSFANGLAVLGGSVPALACNDAFGNASADYSGIADPTGSAGNISADPQFCDALNGSYGVALASPCAPDNSGGCGLIGAIAAGCGGTPADDGSQTVPQLFRVENPYPNPFNPKTTLRFTLPEAGRTRVAIYDVAGRLVQTLLDENLPAQVHEVTWLGRDSHNRSVSAGIYFYLVTSGSHRAAGRMTLVK